MACQGTLPYNITYINFKTRNLVMLMTEEIRHLKDEEIGNGTILIKSQKDNRAI